MKYARSFLLILLTLALAFSAQAEEKRGMQVVPKSHRYALLVGINQYNKPFESLKYCEADMEALEKVLLDLDFSPDNIVRLTTSSEDSSRLPTKSNILRHARLLADEADENSLFIVAFSGHGASYGRESFFCPMDAANKDLNSLVKRSDVYEIIEKCPAKQKLVFVDACRNSLVMEGWKAAHGIKGLVDPVGIENPGFFIISSCKTGQFSWEDKELGHGVFTYFLVEGLHGKAAQNGLISVHSLFSYVNNKTKRYVRLNFEDSQVPLLRGSMNELDDFLIAKLENDPIPDPTPDQIADSEPQQIPDPEPTPSQPPRPAGASKILIEDGIKYEFRWCPPGEFMMGEDVKPVRRKPSEEYDVVPLNNASPIHKVKLTQGFWIMETEVTQEMWKNVMGLSVEQQLEKGNVENSFFTTTRKLAGVGPHYPIYYVSWHDCMEFCEKLSQKLGRKVQLPTEAQWEYACRAGTTGNYAGKFSSMVGGTDSLFNRNAGTIEVGIRTPNPWTLYDMHGNVSEWCSDFYDVDYYNVSPATDPENVTTSQERVYRGGNWDSGPVASKSSSRSGKNPDSRAIFLGFRVILVPIPEEEE